MYLNVRCSFPREQSCEKNLWNRRLTIRGGGTGPRSLLDRGISRLLSQISRQHGRKQLRWISSTAFRVAASSLSPVKRLNGARLSSRPSRDLFLRSRIVARRRGGSVKGLVKYATLSFSEDWISYFCAVPFFSLCAAEYRGEWNFWDSSNWRNDSA